MEDRDAYAPADRLQIAGLVPFSTVDWPGKIAATLFLQGCPWRCPYCHNSAILDPKAPGLVEWGEVRTLLERRKGLLDGVVFSGGEALMQAGSRDGYSPLEAALRETRALGFATGIHVAGAYPKRLQHLLDEGLLDWVGLDIKALPADYGFATGTTTPATGTPVSAMKAEQSLNIMAQHPEVDWEVRLTLWPALAGRGGEGIRASAEGVIDYAQRVALWAHERGAQEFALQRYRIPPTATNGPPKEESVGDAGVLWEEEAALAALRPIGFKAVSIR